MRGIIRGFRLFSLRYNKPFLSVILNSFERQGVRSLPLHVSVLINYFLTVKGYFLVGGTGHP